MFLATMYGGIGVGALYDISRMLRRSFGAGRGVSATIDAFFWCTVTAGLLALLRWADSGLLRAYMLLGVACGWGLYELAASPIIMAVYGLARRFWRRFSQTGLMRKVLK